MKLIKTLNNNVMIVEDSKGNEHILIGRGISFGRKTGEIIDVSLADRIFSSYEGNSNRLLELIQEIPDTYLSLSEEIIEYAESILGKKLADSIYITLTDHISFMIERYGKGILPKNPLKWEIQHYYKKEYSIAEKALELVEDELEIELSNDETASIAMHIVNAQTDIEMHENVELLILIKEITKIVKLLIHVDIEENDINFHRLVTHLNYFLMRIKSETKHISENPLNNLIKQNYRQAYEVSLRIGEFISKQLKYEVSEDELTYLTIHIERIIERKNKVYR